MAGVGLGAEDTCGPLSTCVDPELEHAVASWVTCAFTGRTISSCRIHVPCWVVHLKSTMQNNRNLK